MAEYIERQAAINVVKKWFDFIELNGDICIDGLISLPDTDVVERKVGKWLKSAWSIRCSECGYDMPFAVRNFCPNCGAQMIGGDDDV